LLRLLGESEHGNTTNDVPKQIAFAATKAILSIGAYEHADVLKKMIERNPPDAGGHIFQHLADAIRYKHEGHDFRVEFVKGHHWETGPAPDGSHAGRTGYTPERLILLCGDKLSD
jgi:hypothetical protein